MTTRVSQTTDKYPMYGLMCMHMTAALALPVRDTTEL